MSTASRPVRRFTSMVAVAAMVLGGIVVGAAAAPVAVADPAPVITPPSGAVTADALPTVQIDGVAWSQVVLSNTVYVGGSFANARPAGSAAGQNLMPRANLLSYNMSTGALNTSFAPSLNAQAYVVTTSPDGSRLYVGGDFTTADGQNRYRIAAYNTTTGSLINSFAPPVNARVDAIYATNSTVYAGGFFTAVGSVTRNHLAAFNAADGSLTAWDPNADYIVHAIQMTPDGSKLIIGGAFKNVNNAAAYGLAAVDPVNGTLIPWAAGNVVQDAGDQAAILSLSTDGTSIFGTGYVFGPGGNLEGAFSANQSTGAINWIEDCHGDTYDSFPTNGVLYTVSHAHYCETVGGYPQTDADYSINMRHALAFTTNATGTLLHNTKGGYADWFGKPSPTLIDWFPDMDEGTYTGQSQAAWSVAGNSQYVVLGGEFPTVNNGAQQGLVRFAVKPIAPSKQGAMLTGSSFKPTLVPLSPTSVRVTFASNWDRDDLTLTYKIVRNGDVNHPVKTITGNSTWWSMPTLNFLDTGLSPATSYDYRLFVTDPSGNLVAGDTATIVTPAAGSPSADSPYSRQLIADGAATYLPLDEATGTTLFDHIGTNDADAGVGITSGATGAVSGGDTASTFSGSQTASAATRVAVPGPNTFSLSTWIRTTSTTGGKIIGFGNSRTGSSGNYDRQIYMDNSGKVYFGVCGSACPATVTSTASYNDGQWHQIVGTLGATGIVLYIDGVRIASRTDQTSAQALSGFWRIGGDNLGGWPGAASSNYFKGDIDEVAIFPNVLTKQNVLNEYVQSGRTSPVVAPTDSYGSAVFGGNPDLYYRLGESTGTVAGDASGSGNVGTYRGGITLGQPGALTGTSDTAAKFDGSTGVVVSSTQVANPSVYTAEGWFNTTTTRGGEIIGFGDATSGTSSNADRQVYMQNDGHLAFRTMSGTNSMVVSTSTYNDGNWHYVAATQTSSGMTLYVDGQPAANNTVPTAGNYTGYWRVGGDTTGNSTSAYFAGTIDETAVYPSALSAQTVLAHFNAGGGNVPPNAAFTATVTPLTAAVDASMTVDPDGTIASYAWNFGDSSTGAGKTVSHSYTAAGTYVVVLTATDNRGATSKVSHSVTVGANKPPTANFTSVIANLKVTADASTSSDADGTIASYAWNFGDGTTATGKTAAHTYAADGSYTVTLTVTDDLGATDSATQSVTVAANKVPVAAFTKTAAGLAATADATTSQDPDGTIASYAWDFGDSATATSKTAAHTYAASGTFTITLTVTDNQGATGTTSQSVTVTAPNQPPVAAFTTTTANLVLSTDGTTSKDPDGSIASYAWNFGDGGAATGAKAAHTYAADGTFTVKLTVTDNQGATASTSQSVTVAANKPPVASFTSVIANLKVSTNASTSSDPDGTIASYAWEFGDGATATGQTASHTYSAAGTYTVKLTVTDNQNASTSTTNQLTVAKAANQPPVAAFTNSVANLVVAADASTSNDPDGTIASYAWTFGDGATATGRTTSHTYAAGGTYTVKLTVTDNEGATGSTSQSVSVATNKAPVAAFTSTVTNLNVATDASTSSDSDGTIASYAWTFGDGSTATGKTASHTYSAAGTYTITLKVTDNQGAVASTTNPVQVSAAVNKPPVAAFTSSAANLALALDASTSNDPDGTIASYAWTFGDGATATGKTTSHTYAASGAYQVKLTVTDNSGAATSLTKTVTVTSPAPATYAADAFTRTAANGWGPATTGGSWSLAGPASLFSVDGSAGAINMNGPGVGPSVFLSGVSASNVNFLMDVSINKMPASGGVFVSYAVRHTNNGDYRVKVQLDPSGSVNLYLTKLVAGAETTLQGVSVPGLIYTAGTKLRLRLTVSGTTTATLAAKIWKVGITEPVANQISATDTTASLQGAGTVGLQSYLSGIATNAPVIASFDNLSVTSIPN